MHNFQSEKPTWANRLTQGQIRGGRNFQCGDIACPFSEAPPMPWLLLCSFRRGSETSFETNHFGGLILRISIIFSVKLKYLLSDFDLSRPKTKLEFEIPENLRLIAHSVPREFLLSDVWMPNAGPVQALRAPFERLPGAYCMTNASPPNARESLYITTWFIISYKYL